MGDFERDTAVRARGDGIFECDLRKDWWVVAGPNGGYLGAIVVRALSADPELGSRPLRMPGRSRPFVFLTSMRTGTGARSAS